MRRVSSRIPEHLLILAAIAIVAAHAIAQTPSGPAIAVRQEVYSIAPTRTGTVPLLVDLFVPSGPIRGAVVLAHGGAFTTGSRDLEENKAYGEALASRGFVAAAISYRLHKDAPVVDDSWAIRYREAVRRHPFPRIPEMVSRYGPEYFDAAAASAVDVAAAVRWLRAHAGELGFDPDHVALFGASAGGISSLTVAYALDDYGARPAEVAAVIALRALMIRPEEATNPMRPGDPPLMILHGERDERVPAAYAESLFASATDAGLPVEFLSAPDRGHELGGGALLTRRTAAGATVLERIERFLASAFAGTLESGRRIRERLEPAPPIGSGDSRNDTAGASAATVRPEMTDAIRRLVASTGGEATIAESLYGISRRALLLHDFADARRTDWSYWPRERAGLPLRHMTAQQRADVHAILASVLSAKGYLQVNHVMALEEVLQHRETAGFSRAVEDYTLAVFGSPDGVEPWALRFEGHHVSMNVTVAEDRLSVTPSFIGAAPAPLTSGPRAGFNPLRYEQDAAFALLHTLDPEQRTRAILSTEPPAEILSTQFQVERERWDRWRTALQPDGVPASTFDARQRDRLRALLAEIAGAYRTEISAPVLDAIDVDGLSFAWMGGVAPGERHYFRIQGKEFVFELDAAQEGGRHVHAVWRDRGDDFGADALRRHYRQHRH